MCSRLAAAINSARMLRWGRTRTEVLRMRWCCKEAPRRARVLADPEDSDLVGRADLGRAAPAVKLGLAHRAMRRHLRAPAAVRAARGDCSGSGRIVIDTVSMTRTTVRR